MKKYYWGETLFFIFSPIMALAGTLAVGVLFLPLTILAVIAKIAWESRRQVACAIVLILFLFLLYPLLLPAGIAQTGEVKKMSAFDKSTVKHLDYKMIRVPHTSKKPIIV